LHEFLPHQTNVAFFPLYPFLTRIVARATDTSYGRSALLGSNVCAFTLVYVMYRFVENQWDRRTAILAGLASAAAAMGLVAAAILAPAGAVAYATYLWITFGRWVG
jgi:4-amino-4-deoxy-L-arabinose transferase-like glycosyltransferase